jgi:hypothetical protein
VVPADEFGEGQSWLDRWAGIVREWSASASHKVFVPRGDVELMLLTRGIRFEIGSNSGRTDFPDPP